MHVLGTGVPRRLGVARSASSSKAAQALGCSLTARLRISFGRVTCMAWAASMPGLWTLGFLLLCGTCVWVLVVLGLRFRLHPATAGWGDGVCVCLCARSACTPPLLAGLCGVGVCAWARVSAAPRHSWLGCWGVCVFVWRSACTPPLLAGVCGVAVCAWASSFGCAPPLLAGVFGCVCVCVRTPLVPRQSWLGCVVWACVLGLGFRLRPATPAWGVGLCVCLCACSACTLPLLAGVCGVGVCWGLGFGFAPPLLAGVLGCVCVCVRAPLVPCHSWLGCAMWVRVLGLRFPLCPATPGRGGRVCVCSCARSASSPPLLAGVCGVGVLAWAQVLAAPPHSWLGCAAWVCVLGLGFRLRPATPGSGVGVCVCLCARSACEV